MHYFDTDTQVKEITRRRSMLMSSQLMEKVVREDCDSAAPINGFLSCLFNFSLFLGIALKLDMRGHTVGIGSA